MTNPASNSLDPSYTLFPSPEEQIIHAKYPLNGIILNNQNLEAAINSLQNPDEEIWAAIWIREIEPSNLTCQLLRQAYKIKALNRWAQSKIPIDWLSREGPIGKASRMLLEQEYDEERLIAWLKTNPLYEHLLLVLNSDQLKGKQFPDDALKLMNTLPLEFLAAQSLTHFPWERLEGYEPLKRNDIIQSLKRKLYSLDLRPEGFITAATKARTSKARMFFIKLAVGIPQLSWLQKTSQLLEEELKIAKVETQILQCHLKALFRLPDLSMDDLEKGGKLLLHPSFQWQEKELKIFFDLFLERIIELFTSDKLLQHKALELHHLLYTLAPHEIEERSEKLICSTESILHVNSIISSVEEIIGTYTTLNLDRTVVETSPSTSIHLSFNSKHHFPLLKQYISKLASYRTSSESMNWFLSLFTIKTLHQLIASQRHEASFADSILEEIYLQSTFRKGLHQQLLETLLYRLPEEKAIEVPRVKWLQALQNEQVAVTPQSSAKLLFLINKLLKNRSIGAANYALEIQKRFQESLSPAETSQLRELLADRFRSFIQEELDTEVEIHAFCLEFPQAALLLKRSPGDISHLKEEHLSEGLIRVLQKMFELNKDLSFALLCLESLKSQIDHNPHVRQLMHELADTLLQKLLGQWEKIQFLKDLTKVNATITMCRRILRTLPLIQTAPYKACDIWLSVRLILIRTLLVNPLNRTPAEKELISFYQESDPRMFHAVAKEYRKRVSNQFIEFKDAYSDRIIQAHEEFVREIHPPIDPQKFLSKIAELTAPDDSLIHAVVNSKDEQSLLVLVQHISQLNDPILLNWLLDRLLNRLSGNDSLGSLLRSTCRQIKSNKEMNSHLIKWIQTSPSPAHVLEVLAETLYSNHLLEAIRKLLYAKSTTTDVRNQFYTFYLSQNLNLFPWGWCTQKMPSEEILKSLEHRLSKLPSLPTSLTDYISRSPHLKQWLISLNLPTYLLYEITEIENDLKKLPKKPPLARIQEMIERIINEPHCSSSLINGGLRLLLNPALTKMANLIPLYDKLLDYALNKLLIPHEGFRKVCQNLLRLNTLFVFNPLSKIAQPFNHQPSHKISLAHILFDAEKAFFHYFLPNITLSAEKMAEVQQEVSAPAPQWLLESIHLDFDPNIHGELEWIFLKKLLAIRPKTEEERFVFAFYARVWLHQYALNHASTHLARIEFANDQLYYLSPLKPNGVVDLERVAHSSFPIEKQLYRKPAPGPLKKLFLIQDLVCANPEDLRSNTQPHTEQLHGIFMQMIQTATPDSLEAVERIRHDLMITKLQEKNWKLEHEATEQAFKRSIIPLMNSKSIPHLFKDRPFLMQLAVKHATSFAEPLIALIHSQIPQNGEWELERAFEQLFALRLAQSEVRTFQLYQEAIMMIAQKFILANPGEFMTLRIFNLMVHKAPALAEVSPSLFSNAYMILTIAISAKALEIKPSANQFIRKLIEHLENANIDALIASKEPILPMLSELAERFRELPLTRQKFFELIKGLNDPQLKLQNSKT